MMPVSPNTGPLPSAGYKPFTTEVQRLTERQHYATHHFLQQTSQIRSAACHGEWPGGSFWEQLTRVCSLEAILLAVSRSSSALILASSSSTAAFSVRAAACTQTTHTCGAHEDGNLRACCVGKVGWGWDASGKANSHTQPYAQSHPHMYTHGHRH